jgi:hypothetical protein
MVARLCCFGGGGAKLLAPWQPEAATGWKGQGTTYILQRHALSDLLPAPRPTLTSPFSMNGSMDHPNDEVSGLMIQ